MVFLPSGMIWLPVGIASVIVAVVVVVVVVAVVVEKWSSLL